MSGSEPATSPGGTPAPEARWPVVLTVIAVLVIAAGMPDRLMLLPYWAPFAVAIVALAPMAGVALGSDKRRWLRIERVVLLAVAIFVLGLTVTALATLIRHIIIGGPERLGGLELLTSSVVAWVVNVAGFALLFWQMDAGGPLGRLTGEDAPRDWMFPQAGGGDGAPAWLPGYVDYLYLAFSTATAFSSTDVMPLTARAKVLMMMEATIALVTMVVVASRAINVLGS
ncbi:hypothetical protein AAFN86_03895 [Roseomonas sp. CAU 1739]|uniref:hypothetical protein n=1 Tax=Roseomonas sp. CAU 1739 TaxID=3140364 RepID=UPI00325BA4C5